MVGGGSWDGEIPIEVARPLDARTTKRFRRWGNGLLSAGALYVGSAVVGLLKTIPTPIDVARIEAGERPPVWRFGRRAAFQPNPYVMSGRLGNSKAFPMWTARYSCTPLGSEGAGPASVPSVYVVGYEGAFERARSERGIVGDLSIASGGGDTASDIAAACGVPVGTYLLRAESPDLGRMLWRWAISIGVVLGLLGLAGRLIAARRMRRSALPA